METLQARNLRLHGRPYKRTWARAKHGKWHLVSDAGIHAGKTVDGLKIVKTELFENIPLRACGHCLSLLV